MSASGYKPIDFQNNEALNMVFQNLLSDPVISRPGKVYYNAVKEVPYYATNTEWIPMAGRPVQRKYADAAAMLAAQAIQLKNYIYYLEDEDVYYEYLGTVTSTIGDYNPIGGGGLSNNEVKVIYVDPANLSGIGTIEEQICEWINENLTINYSKHYSKINIVLGVDPNALPEAQEILNGILYNYYAISDPRNISNTGWKIPSWSDVNEMVNFLGGQSIAANSMKETGVVYWNITSGSVTNSSKFNLRGAGLRQVGGSFGLIRHSTQIATSDYNVSVEVLLTPIINSNSSTVVMGGSSGPVQGNSVRLIKESTLLLNGEEGIYIGNDGKVYRTICIGSQEWLADNLAETKYRNGDNIPEVTDQTAWNALVTGARCFYDNNESNAYPI